MDKRGQFFLLAAVIISVVILSLGVDVNRAIVSEEPDSFYDFSYEVKRETGAVIDYEVYSNVDGGELDDFVELLAKNTKENNPDADLMFIYGNKSYLKLKNYGAKDAYVEGEEVPGNSNNKKNKVCVGGVCQEISDEAEDYGEEQIIEGDFGEDEVVVEIGENEFKFPLSEHKQVIFIMQKDVGDEKFVTIG